MYRTCAGICRGIINTKRHIHYYKENLSRNTYYCPKCMKQKIEKEMGLEITKQQFNEIVDKVHSYKHVTI